jgi:hypothetical protein
MALHCCARSFTKVLSTTEPRTLCQLVLSTLSTVIFQKEANAWHVSSPSQCPFCRGRFDVLGKLLRSVCAVYPLHAVAHSAFTPFRLRRHFAAMQWFKLSASVC